MSYCIKDYRLNYYLLHSYPTRLEVDKANFTRLHQLATEAHNYLAMDLPGVDEKGQQVSMDHAKKLLERLIAPSELTVKVSFPACSMPHSTSPPW
jgi:hypothetical protein